MKLRLLGLDHESAMLAERERFFFSPTRQAEFYQRWLDRYDDTEAVLVSTCNRTELYVGTQNGTLPDWSEMIAAILPDEPDAAYLSESLSNDFRRWEDVAAVEHLFAVAASLESMVLGEPQILSQIKEAYRAAANAQTAGIMTHTAFQSALAVAKRIRTETGIARYRISLPAIAVSEFALDLFESLADKTVLVWGAGEMARETLSYLIDAGAKHFILSNRSRERADKIAAEFSTQNGPELSVRVVEWSERDVPLGQADLVVVATAADTPILTRSAFVEARAMVPNKTIFLLDLAVPRNIDPTLRTCSGVYLYAIDDLKIACERNRHKRAAELPKAEKIVRHEAQNFWSEMLVRDSGALIRRLRDGWNLVKEGEIDRLFARQSELSDSQRAAIRYAFDRLVNKLLHRPMETLRELDETERPQTLLTALLKLFRLS